MNHEALVSKIPDLMAGNISWWRKWRLQRHLATCSQCQLEVERYQAIHRDLEQTVPTMLGEHQPGVEFMSRIEQTIASHPLPARSKPGYARAIRFAVPAATAAVLIFAVVLAITLTGGNGVSALSLATPVRGEMTITQGGAPVADGTFAYASPREWERSTTFHRAPVSSAAISEVSIDGNTYSKVGDEPWRMIGETPADRQPIPGLGDLGLAERLFDAVLNLYQLEESGQTQLNGETLTEFVGVDTGYASRIRDSFLAIGASETEAAALFEFYSTNQPEVAVLADGDERIRAIFMTVPLWDVPDPMLVELVISEFNATVSIVSPLG